VPRSNKLQVYQVASSSSAEILNRGVSFGMWEGISIGWIFLAWLVILYILVRTSGRGGKLALGMILIGGSLNLSERIILGGVSDPWPFFGIIYNNLADYLIIIGVVVYGYCRFTRR
jgi:lipoprotein signal peptidase